MSSDAEPQQVALALMAEEETLAPRSSSKSRRSRKICCTENYIVGYGIPILILILIVVFFVLMIIYVRRYNQNCSYTKGESCRGILWYFN